jgi:hypothetical protein
MQALHSESKLSAPFIRDQHRRRFSLYISINTKAIVILGIKDSIRFNAFRIQKK